jgi:hypothetical protein
MVASIVPGLQCKIGDVASAKRKKCDLVDGYMVRDQYLARQNISQRADPGNSQLFAP